MSVIRFIAVGGLAILGFLLGAEHATGLAFGTAALLLALTAAKKPTSLDIASLFLAGAMLMHVSWSQGTQTLRLIAALVARIEQAPAYSSDAEIWSDITW